MFTINQLPNMNKAFILFILIALISCDQKENDLAPLVDTYPMAIGTEWTYDRQLILDKYESETSDKIIGTDTFHFVVRVWIDKDTILGTMPVKAFKCQEEHINSISTQFKFIDKEGLKTYAYLNAGGPIVFAKKSGHIKSPLPLNFVWDHSTLAGDGIIYESNPTLDIKLPLKNNQLWTYRKPTDLRTLQIDKQVIGMENINLIGQNFTCYKIDWTFRYDSSYTVIKITDWISDKGLVKRIQMFDRVKMIDELGETFKSFQVTEYLTLKGIKIE